MVVDFFQAMISISLQWQDVLSLGVALVSDLLDGCLLVVAPHPGSCAHLEVVQRLAGLGESESVASLDCDHWIAADHFLELPKGWVGLGRLELQADLLGHLVHHHDRRSLPGLPASFVKQLPDFHIGPTAHDRESPNRAVVVFVLWPPNKIFQLHQHFDLHINQLTKLT